MKNNDGWPLGNDDSICPKANDDNVVKNHIGPTVNSGT